MKANRLFKTCGVLGKCNRGTAAVEMGFLAPVIVAIAIGMFEYAAAIQQSMHLTSAARVGADYAVVYPDDKSGIEQATVESGRIEPMDLSINIERFCECPDGTPVDCADSCSGALNHLFVQVALSQPARSLLTSSGMLPSYTVSGRAAMRVR